MLIIGLHDKKLQERLLRKINLILDEFQNKVSQNSKKRYSKKPKILRTIFKIGNDNEMYFCSHTHKRGSCLTYGKICHSYHKKGHFSKRRVNLKRDMTSNR